VRLVRQDVRPHQSGPKAALSRIGRASDRERELYQAVSTLPGLSDVQAAMKLANDKRSPFYVRGTSPSDGVRGLRSRIGKVRKKFAGTK
ncbi:hypothetical protein, partial [Bradyrhizobium liaoningense]|uniref:hypothetical protein n=1 Tax=Bradyrhizobium liaoningense TaxID=43992 RepID=UPI001BA5F412